MPASSGRSGARARLRCRSWRWCLEDSKARASLMASGPHSPPKGGIAFTGDQCLCDGGAGRGFRFFRQHPRRRPSKVEMRAQCQGVALARVQPFMEQGHRTKRHRLGRVTGTVHSVSVIQITPLTAPSSTIYGYTTWHINCRPLHKTPITSQDHEYGASQRVIVVNRAPGYSRWGCRKAQYPRYYAVYSINARGLVGKRRLRMKQRSDG